ncbi:MAG: carbon monoxide dehydrogenase maturation protein [Candidatus Dadabacteria bacterium]|nr:MAG: carbon monoxide dehydrogenase maturation protein [Candidatus Dadabacteria bacterium]
MMTKALVDSGRAGRLLVIDADPALGQLSALGASVRRTMGQVREEVIETAKRGNKEAKAELAEKLDYMVFESLCEMDDFALLAMGRTETLGCFCSVNGLLRRAIEMLADNFDTILIDGEAGLEQINRQVVRNLDTLMIISDPTARGMETAAVIRDMVDKDHIIECQRKGIVFNRVRDDGRKLRESAEKLGLELFGLVPQDETIAEYDLEGRPITSLPAEAAGPAAVRDIVERVILRD